MNGLELAAGGIGPAHLASRGALPIQAVSNVT